MPVQVGDWVEAGSGDDYDRGTVLEIDGEIATVGWRGACCADTVRLAELRPYPGDDLVQDPWPREHGGAE